MEEVKKEAELVNRIRRLDAADERQYMINEHYEVYEKQGAPLGAIAFHYHNFYEIIYVLEGEYSSMIEDRTYHLHKGDFLLIDQNIMHKYNYMERKHDNSKRIILWVTRQMLERLGEKDMDLASCFGNRDSCAYHFPIYYEELLRGYLLKLAMTQIPEEAAPGAKAVFDRGYLALFFGYLNILCKRGEYLFTQEDLIQHKLVEQVSDYVKTHMGEKITVEELAEQVHMSKYHFLRRFKELTGVTVHTFVTDMRLIKACEAIREGMNITQVYQTAGFVDYSSFLRNFKNAFGVSPRKYKDFYPDNGKSAPLD